MNDSAEMADRFVPVIVMVAPTAPLIGLNPVIVGVGSTVKLAALKTVTPLTVTEILPVVAPGGTEVEIEVDVDALTTAGLPSKVTA